MIFERLQIILGARARLLGVKVQYVLLKNIEKNGGYCYYQCQHPIKICLWSELLVIQSLVELQLKMGKRSKLQLLGV